MKSLLKKHLSTVLAITILITSCTAFATPALAAEVDNTEVEYEKIHLSASEQLFYDIEKIEEYINVQGTSVLDELEKQQNFYTELIENETNELEAQKLRDLLATNKELISSYELYLDIKEDGEINREIGETEAKAVVAAIVAYFNLNGYVLSSELLMHAQDNETVDSIYEPYFRNRVAGTSVIQNIKRSSKSSGQSNFEKDGTSAGNDCYCAIHGFNWTKNSHNAVTISDRYDYEIAYNYTGIQQYAVNAMWLCQQLGYIVPFQLRIYNI